MHAEQRHFYSIYDPVSVLPPDQYGTVVLQAVTGCPFNCSFCTLYRTTDVTVRSIEAFEAHVEAVKSFFGRGLSSRRGVFVGDGNPLAVPEQLSGMLAVAARILPNQVERGVLAFGNVRTVANLSQQSLETLAEKGLERVAVGAESGSNTILELLRKPQTPGEIREGIDRLKSADIDVSVILLAGVGGSELAETHLSRTTELVASLPLDSDDIVYVSPLVRTYTADYADRLEVRCLSPLSDDEIALQATTLHSRLENETPARVARYTVSESIYV
ncbi:MAG: radical SAM protein [Natronomonas sp.]